MAALRTAWYAAGRKARKVVEAGPFITRQDAEQWTRGEGLSAIVIYPVRRPV